MRPIVLRGRDGIQLSFDLPYRISDACIYPRRPTNGSHVIICAHDKGLRVIWYAGKRLTQERAQPNVNGNTIDLTDEGDDGNSAVYEQEEEEVNPARPFHGVLGYKDIQLDSAVTKLAVPPHSLERNDDFHQAMNTHAFVVVACADLSIRLICIPLQFEKAKDEEVQQTAISGSDTHQDLISDVAITITATVQVDDDARAGRTRSRSSGRDTKDSTGNLKEWSILIASTSPTGTGLLLIHQVYLSNTGQLFGTRQTSIPVQRRFLRCLLAQCHIEFNPSLYPSHRHSYLLIAPADGAATKVYQTLPGVGPIKKRRGSTATVDSTASTNQPSKRNPFSDKVLIDLLSPFHQAGETSRLATRKLVLDARWVLHGRAILALLDDGDWGIWDLEAAGPSTATSTVNLVKAQSDISGIQGGSVSKFSIQGSAISSSSGKQFSSSGNKSGTGSSLAPMTPHTRKQRSDGLFKGKDQEGTISKAPASTSNHGSIGILVQSDKNTTKSQDESVVLSYGLSNTFIPSLQAFWRSEGNSTGSFDGSATARPVVLPQLQLAGEKPKSIHLLPTGLTGTTEGLFATTKPTQNFLVATSSRLILHVAPLVETSSQSQTTSLSARLLAASSTNQDQMLLDSGELDIDGMDRILDSMANSGALTEPATAIPFSSAARKSVGFRLDNDDEDITMESPTTSKSSRSKLTVNSNRSRQDSAKRLFT